MADNIYGCPLTLWRKWSEFQRVVYNDVMGHAEDQYLLANPRAPRMTREHWQTLRHNMAFLAAEAVRVASRATKNVV